MEKNEQVVGKILSGQVVWRIDAEHIMNNITKGRTRRKSIILSSLVLFT